MENEFSGYCTFNSVSIATTHALNLGLERQAMVTFCHIICFSIHVFVFGDFDRNFQCVVNYLTLLKFELIFTPLFLIIVVDFNASMTPYENCLFHEILSFLEIKFY